MGVFYNSICIPGNESSRVRDSLERWLALRGFRLAKKQPVLFDLDGEVDRSAFLIWNERWTVLVFSKYEEERRLIRELQNWASLVTYIWVFDSDVWGYDLLDQAGFVASFGSDPKSYHPFTEEEEDGEALGSEGRPMADLQEVCQRLGLGDKVDELSQIQRPKASFPEERCLEFCSLLGVEAAMVSYDDLERGNGDQLGGWRSEQLLFIHQDAAEDQAANLLHQLKLSSLESGPDWIPQQPSMVLQPDVRAEMEEMRRRVRRRLVILKPITWLARKWRKFRGEARPIPLPVDASPSDEHVVEIGSPSPPRPALNLPTTEYQFNLSDLNKSERTLVNERHRCWITLAQGAEAKTVSNKPSSVFAFQVGETPVTCTARRLDKMEDILRPPSRSEVLRDKKYKIANLQARHLLFQLPPLYLAGLPDPSYLGLYVVQTPLALYVFLYRHAEPLEDSQEQAIRRTVGSFRLQD